MHPPLLTLLAVLAAAPAPPKVKAEVRYVHADKVFLGVGTGDGVGDGALVEALYKGNVVARLRVEKAAAHHSSAVLLGEPQRMLRPGDVAMVQRNVPVAGERAAPPPVRTVSRPVWQEPPSGAFPTVAFKASHGNTWVPPPRASAFLQTRAWLSNSGSPSNLTVQQRLRFAVDTALDAQDHWHASAYGSVVGQVSAPLQAGGGANSQAWLELHEAQLRYRDGKGLEIGVGRNRVQGLRYGPVDGARASWTFNRGLVVRALVGQRPDSITMRPDYRRPAALVQADGAMDLRLASASYGVSAMWLGKDVLGVEGLELAGQAAAQVMRMVSLDANAAVLVRTLDGHALPAANLDRLGGGASLRLGSQALVRVSARRQGGVVLASQSAWIPLPHRNGIPSYDVNALFDGTIPLPLGIFAGVVLSSGAIMDRTHTSDRFYVAPELRVRLSRLWRLALRAGARLELGQIKGELFETGATAEPIQGVRLGIWQQSGAWILDGPRQQVLPTSQWSVTSEYSFLRVLTTGVRLRSLFGSAGTGYEVTAWVGAVDWL